MIRIWCDHCGNEVEQNVYAVISVEMGKRDTGRMRFHACESCQAALRMYLDTWASMEPRTVRR